MGEYREVFLREEGFEHIKRYISGLILSPNKSNVAVSWEKGEERI